MGRKRGCCVLGVLQGKPGALGLHGVKEEGRKSGLIGKLQGEQPGLAWLCPKFLWTCREWRMKECVELREKHVSFPHPLLESRPSPFTSVVVCGYLGTLDKKKWVLHRGNMVKSQKLGSLSQFSSSHPCFARCVL